MKPWIFGLVYALLAPVAGGLLAGVDRKLTARLQGRVGPPLLQPFYDVGKLLEKETLVVRRSQNFYVYFFLVFIVFTGALFFSGEDMLLVIFAFMLAGIFLVLGGYKASSPYSHIGAHRELIQTMACEPAVIMVAVGMYLVTGSFRVNVIIADPRPLIALLPGVFFAYLYVVPNKLRKSPFDLSTSHHAHQELVKGLTTEFSGRGLAAIELAHWYEMVLVLGIVYIFFASMPLLGVAAALLVYLAAIFVDNACARVRWPLMLWSSWLVALVFGFGNIIALFWRRS